MDRLRLTPARTVILALLFFHSPPKSSTDLTVAMSATSWIQSHLTPLYGAADIRFGDAFDQVFSPACELRLNHAAQTLQTFKDDLAFRRAAATHMSVAWNADMISTNEDNLEQPAVVAGAFIVTHSLPFRIRAGAAQRLIHVHFSARIERDADVGGDDQRRITSFYYTFVDTTPPIHFAVPRAIQDGGQ